LATSFAVDLVFRSQTQELDRIANKIQKFERDLGRLKGSDPFQGVENSAKSAGNAAEKAGRQAQGAAQGFGALRGAISGLAIGAFVKTIYSAAAEIERTKVQLKTLVGTAEGAERVFSQLQQINKQSPFELKDLTGAAAKLSAFGVSASNLVDTTERLGKIAAGTGQSLDGIATAYGQVLAKGRLQGEELLQFQERGIDLGGELQRMLGATKEQFADMTSKGQISSRLVEEAIKRMTSETGRFGNAFENTANSMDAKLSNLKDAFFNAAAALGKAFEPVFRWMIDQLTTILSMVTDSINRWQGVQKLTPERTDQLRQQAETEANKRFPGFNPFSNAKGDFFNKRFNELTDAEIAKVVKASQASTLTAKPAPAPGVAPDAQARYRSMLTQGNGGGGSKKAATGPKLPEYIDKEVLRKWLYSQGMGRTSGDFTNAGHRTPNHMLNAMDMGFTSSKFGHNYVQKTKEMEAKLRATGAFGDQLFGPTRDPIGHKDHLHIPTPGGKVKMTPALARLMGMSGAGAEGSYDLEKGLMEQETARLEKMNKQLEAAKELAAASEGELKIKQSLSQADQIRAQYAETKRKIEAEYESKLSEVASEEERALLSKSRGIELQLAELDQAKQLKDLRDGAISSIQEENAALEAKLAGKQEEYELQKKINDLLAAAGGTLSQQEASALVLRNEELKKQVAILDEVNSRWQSLASTIEGEIGSAMSNAIIGLIDGTQTAEQAFGQMFKNIGKAFIDMATQMIAKALVMKVLGIFGGGGSLFGGGGAFNPFASTPGLKLFAEGGFVTGPTPAVIGEGGESEYVIPASKMSSAMANYSAGKRGSSVIADSGTAASGEGAGGAINVTYTVERINERNYVSEEAFQRGLHQAAKQGAEGGYNKTMGAMRNSRSQRSRIGLQ
jgi:tape measure domain-containing protein